MSQKYQKNQFPDPQAGSAPAPMAHGAEYRIIKLDLIKVLILNLIYLAGILGLYYANKKSGLVDNWFAKVLNF